MQQPNPYNNSPEKNVRHLRHEPRKRTEIMQDDGQGWAVSYSDMLMVLMSFFVIFYSNEEKQPVNILKDIAMEIHSESQIKAKIAKEELSSPKTVQKETQATPEKPTNIQANDSLKEIADALSSQTISNSLNSLNNAIIVDLPDQIYLKRQFEMNHTIKQQLIPLFKVLKQRPEKLALTFIGHTDSSNIRDPGKFLANNTDLSSLRASRAMAYALEFGFDLKNLSSQGLQSNVRNTRSLSIKIELFDKKSK